MSRLLIDEQPLMVLPQLAAQIGLNEAIVLQQVHYWTSERRHVQDGRSWTYNTIVAWQKQFPFWSSATIRRTIDSLVEKGLLIKRKLSENKFDATLWYSVDVDALKEFDLQSDLLKLSTCVAHVEHGRSAQVEQITSTETTETTTETTKASPAPKISFGENGEWSGISDGIWSSWNSAYPALDLDRELAKAGAWLLANPKNKKSNYARFLTNWLGRAQDSAPRVSEKRVYAENDRCRGLVL